MDSSRHERISGAFLRALALSGSQRDSYLDELGSIDSALRAEVESLLAAESRRTFSVLDAGDSVTETLTATDRPETPVRQIGQYTIQRVIDSGGMGTVYQAMQERPRRTVAVKVMTHGMAGRSAMRRFEYEAQVLARLRHPGIAQIFEAGMHQDREGLLGPAGATVPYFAMEYIPSARPITTYARENKLGTRDRLRLFIPVCDAVHHGHQKGVIHRDLKPSNILVDSDGLPKVIDFGVARSTNSDIAATTLQTDVGQLVGTLQYMSPEQCAADPHDIDIRSDVYALGVVLYELLCSHAPYDVHQRPIHEVTRVIREETPAKLSTTDRALRGDVETIVLKALEKDRARRYQSAAEFAQDLRRFLGNEPILARPPSVLYQIRVFARRNRAVFTAIATVFVVLVAGVVVSTSLYVRAEAARRDAIAARDLAQQGFQGRYHWNLRNREGIETSIEAFKATIREHPNYAPAHLALAQSYIVMAGHCLGTPKEFAQKAKAEAVMAVELDGTLGDARALLGTVRGILDFDWSGAEKEFRTAIALNPVSATMRLWFSDMLIPQGRYDEALAEARRAQNLDPLSPAIGAGTAAVLYFGRRYDEAVELCEWVLRLEPTQAIAHEFLGRSLLQKGLHTEAVERLRIGTSYPDQSPRLLGTLAGALAIAGSQAEARELLDELRESSRQRYVPAYYLAIVHVALDEKDTALELLQQAYEERGTDLRLLGLDPMFDPLRSDPRFLAILRKLNVKP